jgi:hypothetical protein
LRIHAFECGPDVGNDRSGIVIRANDDVQNQIGRLRVRNVDLRERLTARATKADIADDADHVVRIRAHRAVVDNQLLPDRTLARPDATSE